MFVLIVGLLEWIGVWFTICLCWILGVALGYYLWVLYFNCSWCAFRFVVCDVGLVLLDCLRIWG